MAYPARNSLPQSPAAYRLPHYPLFESSPTKNTTAFHRPADTQTAYFIPKRQCKYDYLVKKVVQPQVRLSNIYGINTRIDSLIGHINQPQYHLQSRSHIFQSQPLQYQNISKIRQKSLLKRERYYVAQNAYPDHRKKTMEDKTMQYLNQRLQIKSPLKKYQNQSLYFLQSSTRIKNNHDQYSVSQSSNEKRSKSLMVKGKNIDQEIDKIQNRIKSIEKLKKQLKIDFIKDKQNAIPEQVSIPKPLRQLKARKDKNQRLNTQNFEFSESFAKKEEIQPEKKTIELRSNQKNSLHKLLKAFDKQIHLDYLFREKKQWFKELKDPQKWKKINKVLKQQKIFISQFCTKIMFGLSQEQGQQNKYQVCTINSLIEAFVLCQSNWNSEIAKKHSQQGLQRDGFTENKLDVSHRGHISLDDLTRFCNYFGCKNYKSKQMYLLFDRVRKGQQLNYKDLIQAVCF